MASLQELFNAMICMEKRIGVFDPGNFFGSLAMAFIKKEWFGNLSPRKLAVNIQYNGMYDIRWVFLPPENFSGNLAMIYVKKRNVLAICHQENLQ